MSQLILELSPAPEPTLENYFPGRNGLALAAVRELLQGAERLVYLWGGRGCGKSHLLRAFAAEARALGLRAAYGCAPHIDVAMPLDALAVDEVSELDARGQLDLFDAYNRLHALGGAMLASADRPPRELALRGDLRTRMSSGVVLQMHALGDEDKRAALLAHAAGRGMELGEDIIDHLLKRHARDMGSLVALVDAIDRYSLQAQRAVTLALVREIVRNPA
jgi:DnaA family protein